MIMPFLIALFSTVAIGLGLAAILYHVCKPREKRVDHFNPLSPTLRWMNTAGSILLAANPGTDFRELGGYGPRMRGENYQKSVKTSLWEYWGIQGHEEAVEEMRTLITRGMRRRYGEEMARLDRQYQGYSEEQLIEVAKQTNPKANEDSFLPSMLMAYRRYGENALLGWDMGRCAYIIQWCYLVGYVDMQEMLDIGVEAGKKAQAFFQNWEEMTESYLLGGQYWAREDRNDPNSMTAERWKLYEKLWKGKKPYRECPYIATPFDLPLSNEIVTDQYGILPEYQKYYKYLKKE